MGSHPSSNSGLNPALRSDRSVRSVKGVARLGRVPEGEAGDDESKLPVVRRPSMNARDMINENPSEESRINASQRASENPPALPQKDIQQMSECARVVSTNPSAVAHAPSSSIEEAKEEQEPSSQEDGSRTQSSRSHQEQQQPHPAHTTTTPPATVQPTPTVQSQTIVQDTITNQTADTTRLSHNSDDAPPRPPERPPKKPTLRSLFHGPNPDGTI